MYMALRKQLIEVKLKHRCEFVLLLFVLLFFIIIIKIILVIITKTMFSKNPADIKEQTIRRVDKYTDHRL